MDFCENCRCCYLSNGCIYIIYIVKVWIMEYVVDVARIVKANVRQITVTKTSE